MKQAEIIRDQIISCDPGITVEIHHDENGPEIKYWIRVWKRSAGKGLFVKELDRALMDAGLISPCTA